MEINAALLCDFAQVRGGLLTIVNGGITRLFPTQLSDPFRLYLALVLEVAAHEQGPVHEVKVEVVDPETAQVIVSAIAAFQAGENPNLMPGETLLAPMALVLQGPCDHYGPRDVRITVDSSTKLLTFWITDRLAPTV